MKKLFLFALGLAAVAACGGKVVVEADTATGTGGAGGTATTITTADGAPNPTTNVSASASVSVSVAVVSSSAVTTGSGMGGCDPGYTCAEAITPPGDPANLCDGTVAAKLYDGLVQCICVDACQIECAGNICSGDDLSPSCKTCITDPMLGCGQAFNECINSL